MSSDDPLNPNGTQIDENLPDQYNSREASEILVPDIHYPTQVEDDGLSVATIEGIKQTSSVLTIDGISDNTEHCIMLQGGSQVSNLQIEFKQMLINLGDKRNLNEIIYKNFLETIHRSTANDLERQTPVFVMEIMARKSGTDLFNLLQSKTPYCDLFNFLDFFEQIIEKIDENVEHIKKVVSRSKEILHCTKKDEIKPFVKNEDSGKEDFTKVVLQMYKTFKVYTGGDIQSHKNLTSFILKLQNLVCFVGYNEDLQTVTYLIPSILTERAYNNASQIADRFFTNGILCITIGGNKIFERVCESIPKSQQFLSVNKPIVKIKVDVESKLSFSIDVKLLDPITTIKWKIYKELCIPINMQTLRLLEESLEDDKTVEFYNIEEGSIIFLIPEMESAYHDMIELLPTNCQFVVRQWEQLFSEINEIYRNLSCEYDHHATIYEHLLPYVFEKCGYNFLKFIDAVMNAIKDPNKQKSLQEIKSDYIARRDESTNDSTDSGSKEVATRLHSSEQKANELKVPVMKKYAQQLNADTNMLSSEHHIPTISRSIETNSVKDMNLIHKSAALTSTSKDGNLPSNLVDNEDFIEIKARYHDILHLMPNDYHQTLNVLQKYISDDDEIAGILGSNDPEKANKQILDWLIQKMKKREEMLDFCIQLEQIITSQDLKMIINEIQTGVQQSIQFSDSSDSTVAKSVTASDQNSSLLRSFMHPLLQPRPLHSNFVQRENILNDITAKLCDTTSNPDAVKIVVSVTGVGGFGKTTIVTALCHDPQVQKKFSSGFLFIDLGPQATDPIIKLNEIYLELVGQNISNVETEMKRLTKDNLHDLLVIIDDVWHADDARPIIKAFSNCHIVLTTRSNDIAKLLTTPDCKNILEVGPMTLDIAVAMLTDKLLDLSMISNEDVELLKELAQDAHMWPLLLCLVRGQLSHQLKLNVHVHKAVKSIQGKLHDRGLTAFDKKDVESISKIRSQSVSICIETTLELLPKNFVEKYITLILFTGIGGCFSKEALQSLWNTSDSIAKTIVSSLSVYGLVSFKNIPMSHYLRNQVVVVYTHSVISQYMFDHIRSDQVANLSPFGTLFTNNTVGEKLVSLFKTSYGVQNLSQLTFKEYLIYTMHQTEYVFIPFHLKRITAHILHDPHVILLMLQRIQTVISTSVSHIKIITQFSEQFVTLDHRCKQALKDAQVLNRNINLKVQHFLFAKNYAELEKTLEEHCRSSIGSIAQDCIELINQVMQMCEDSLLENFEFVHQMLETMTPQHHFITMEKLPILKLYVGLHKEIDNSLKKGSTELYKMYNYTAYGEFNEKLRAVSSHYKNKLQEIAPNVLSGSLAMYKK